MNKPTVQDIFQRFYPAYLEKHSPSPIQAKVATNILNCKTGTYGANVSVWILTEDISNNKRDKV